MGLSDELVDQHFTWTASKIGGIGANEVEKEALDRHGQAFSIDTPAGLRDLEMGGFYQWRRDGEFHQWNPDAIAKLQYAARTNDWGAYQEFARLTNDQSRRLATLRGLLEFNKIQPPVPLEEVESTSEIVKRVATGAISLGSISREAHETMGIAMNRLGARSNTGCLLYTSPSPRD